MATELSHYDRRLANLEKRTGRLHSDFHQMAKTVSNITWDDDDNRRLSMVILKQMIQSIEDRLPDIKRKK